MTTFKIDRTASTPAIELRADEHRLTFEGDCYPENPLLFFAPVTDAVDRHLARTPECAFRAEFRLRYVNSASTKALRRLLGRLDGAGRRGARVKVLWEHDHDDEESPELAELLADDLPFVELELRAVDPG